MHYAFSSLALAQVRKQCRCIEPDHRATRNVVTPAATNGLVVASKLPMLPDLDPTLEFLVLASSNPDFSLKSALRVATMRTEN
jgi:hypothetical protein